VQHAIRRRLHVQHAILPFLSVLIPESACNPMIRNGLCDLANALSDLACHVHLLNRTDAQQVCPCNGAAMKKTK
jgi:hypothetical protein